jgi:hypothetical protein
MKHRHLAIIVVVLVSLTVSSLFVFHDGFSNGTSAAPKSYVGVEIGASNVTAVENEINQVSAYTNLIVIGGTGITSNQTALQQVCQYAYDRNMYFIIYATSAYSTGSYWLKTAYNAKVAWGNNFLGLYAGDEAGGKQLDTPKTSGSNPLNFVNPEETPNNYSDAEAQFVNLQSSLLNGVSGGANVPLYTSDYALYWFDYKAGYDTVFTEFGWNNSRQMDIALCRGAASVQGKDWGAMITWTYEQAPYLESGAQLLSDMKLAYDNGAKYIIVFDDDGKGGGILGADQLNAMQQFWQYTRANHPAANLPSERVAYVLPDAYGYGFRSPTDNIWGVWQADNFTAQLWTNLNSVMQQYGNKLDVIYDDASFPNYTSMYSKLIFWNGTTV